MILMFMSLLFATELQTAKIQLKDKTITVELAQTEEHRNRGLMFRKSLKPDHGMLFIFEKERILSFWMKNTLIPLSIAYFNKDKVLVDIQKMYPQKQGEKLKNYPSKKPALYALEMELGWFEKKSIGLGSRFSFL